MNTTNKDEKSKLKIKKLLGKFYLTEVCFGQTIAWADGYDTLRDAMQRAKDLGYVHVTIGHNNDKGVMI